MDTGENHRVRIVLMENNALLLLYRSKNGKEFYSFPGGGVEKEEALESAVIREAKEETGYDVIITKQLWAIENMGRMEHFFMVRRTGGELALGGPEKERQSENNVYKLEWVPLQDLKNRIVFPEETKQKIAELFLQ